MYLESKTCFVRIRERDQQKILQVISSALDAPFKVYLFGSRIDDTARGGDIDLLILSDSDSINKWRQKKRALIVAIHKEIGERKLDIVFDSDPPKLDFVREILPTAIEIGA
jgi:uncharacterized protein